MSYNKPILNCSCGKKPKLEKGMFNYVRYYCEKCNSTFHHRLEILARESWNAMINRGIDKIRVKI